MDSSLLQFGFNAEKIIKEGRTTTEAVSKIRSWSTDEDVPLLTDEQIVLFLLSCENDIKLTETTIKSNFNLKNKSLEVFGDRKIIGEASEQSKTIGKFCLMPKLTRDNSAIIYFHFPNINSSEWNFQGCVKQMCMVLDAALYDYPPNDLIIISDMNDMTIGHVLRLRPGGLQVIFSYLQQGLPLRLRNIHLINAPVFVDKVLSIIRPLCSKEVMSRITCHPKPIDLDAFDEWVPREYLPEDIGGGMSSVEKLNCHTMQKLIDLENFFKADELQRNKANEILEMHF